MSDLNGAVGDIDDDISAVIRCISYDVDFTSLESILKSQIYCQVNPLVSFVSLENQCIFSVYDDRGCDIVFFCKEKYKEFYIKLEQYFLDYDREKMRETFEIPENIEPVALLVMGYPASDAVPNERHTVYRPMEETVFYNEF